MPLSGRSIVSCSFHSCYGGLNVVIHDVMDASLFKHVKVGKDEASTAHLF